MATELVTFKMDSKLLKEVDQTAKIAGYHNRTEMIRAALRKEMDTVRFKEAMKKIAHLRGASKKKTTEEEYERIRAQIPPDEELGEKVFRRVGL